MLANIAGNQRGMQAHSFDIIHYLHSVHEILWLAQLGSHTGLEFGIYIADHCREALTYRSRHGYSNPGPDMPMTPHVALTSTPTLSMVALQVTPYRPTGILRRLCELNKKYIAYNEISEITNCSWHRKNSQN